jgi:hypothetical protein
LLAMFDHAVEERFLKPKNRALVLARDSSAEVLQALEEWRPTQVEKRLSRKTGVIVGPPGHKNEKLDKNWMMIPTMTFA